MSYPLSIIERNYGIKGVEKGKKRGYLPIKVFG